MTNPFLTLEGVSHSLPDGRRLFAGIDFHLDQRPTGLVGANGVGKSLLAAIMAGRMAPSHGLVRSNARIAWLPQQVTPTADATVATLAGVATTLAALARIEAGSTVQADFDRIGEHWDVRERLLQALADDDLHHLSPEQPAQSLSGGERMRVALIGAWLTQADVLILDEPSNHLDGRQRQRLLGRLASWTGGLLVVSHDREVLSAMQRIVELSPTGLGDYDGSYAYYTEQRSRQQDLAQQRLTQAKNARNQVDRELRRQREQLEKRSARETRKARDSNQAKVLLGNLRQWSQNNAGKQHRRHDDRAESARLAVREAAAQVEPPADRLLVTPLPDSARQRRVLVAESLVLAHGVAGGQALSLIVSGGERIALTGDNGSGKSTLLRTLAGQLDPHSGCFDVPVPMAYLDQQLVGLDAQSSPLDLLQDANPTLDQARARTQLALLGLPASTALTALGKLSGGERLKTALACALVGPRPAELLLLDEPGNHLDLPSLEALERMLVDYTGALVIASHDPQLLARLTPTRQLRVSGSGWQMSPW